MPPGKEGIISQKDGSPTQHLITQWIKKMGRQATLHRLLSALSQCDHGELISNIEKTLRVEYVAEVEPDQVDNVNNIDQMMATVQIATEEKPAKVVPLKLIMDIPEVLKVKLIEQFDALEGKDAILGQLATNITERRCYAQDATEFLDKIKEMKIRFLFRELKENNDSRLSNIAIWMRNNFPVGSTGPLKAGDKLRASKMSYMHRREITKILDLDGQWKAVAEKAGMKHIDIKYHEQRSKEPAEDVFSFWEVRSETTVGALYELLVSADRLAIADLL